MKLLIVTQVVDIEHPVLGFFHRWIEEFAKHCEVVHVICLQKGVYSFPAHVHVHSLGKEEGKGRLIYLLRFYKYIWSLRKEYDRVFVHMNQIYVLLGAMLWKVRHVPVSLWYMHKSIPSTLVLAEKFVNRIFTGSEESFRVPSKKVVVTGHGIDTARFSPRPSEKNLDLITVGRITESKNLLALIDALVELRASHSVTLTIVGEAVTEKEAEYEAMLRSYATQKGVGEAVIFYGKVVQAMLPPLLNRAKIFVTAAQNGSLDKAVLEAMACGVPVVSMAPGTASLPLVNAQTKHIESFIEEINEVLQSKVSWDQNLIEFVKTNHSLKKLIPILLAYDK